MRTDTNGSSERSHFDLAQRVVLWLRSQGYTRKSTDLSAYRRCEVLLYLSGFGV